MQASWKMPAGGWAQSCHCNSDRPFRPILRVVAAYDLHSSLAGRRFSSRSLAGARLVRMLLALNRSWTLVPPIWPLTSFPSIWRMTYFSSSVASAGVRSHVMVRRCCWERKISQVEIGESVQRVISTGPISNGLCSGAPGLPSWSTNLFLR